MRISDWSSDVCSSDLVRDEPHIEHSVSLIDHEEIASGEKDITAPEQVHKPSRRGNQHIDALFQRLYLIPHRHATNEQRHAKFIILAVFLKIFGALSHEFPGGLTNKRPGHTRAHAAMRQTINQRQADDGSYSGTWLST